MNINRFRVRPGDRSAIHRIRPDETDGVASKHDAAKLLQKGVERLATRQELLYAQNQYALLIVLQGMDAAGKDSAIKHVMSGVNPLGTDVHAFKQPSSDELGHDFLWRTTKVLPSRGRIGIFNRSSYEEVLVVRVHPEILRNQRIPADLLSRRIWDERFEDIRTFERHLWRNGTVIIKCFLNVSKAEQRRRLLERLDDPAKNWKFSAGDLPERERWQDYMRAYEDALAATSTKRVPWYVIPADRKWYARLVISEIIVKTLDDLDLEFPEIDAGQKRGLALARRQLTRRS